MNHYEIKHSIALIDGKETMTCVKDFLESQLEGAELEEFLSDLAAIREYIAEAESEGKYTYGEIHEDIVTDDGEEITIQVGETYDIADDRPWHPYVAKWIEKFSKDPRVIKFEPMVLVSHS